LNHLPLASAEVKNEWSYTSNLHIRLKGVDKENVTEGKYLFTYSMEQSPS